MSSEESKVRPPPTPCPSDVEEESIASSSEEESTSTASSVQDSGLDYRMSLCHMYKISLPLKIWNEIEDDIKPLDEIIGAVVYAFANGILGIGTPRDEHYSTNLVQMHIVDEDIVWVFSVAGSSFLEHDPPYDLENRLRLLLQNAIQDWCHAKCTFCDPDSVIFKVQKLPTCYPLGRGSY